MCCFVNTKPVLAGKVQGDLTNNAVPPDSPVQGLLCLGLGRKEKKKKAMNAVLAPCSNYCYSYSKVLSRNRSYFNQGLYLKKELHLQLQTVKSFCVLPSVPHAVVLLICVEL